jgi:beta-lactamase superfamily II metal-dependent hydrolase
MKITVFQSNKGDCLLLTGKDGKRILADGGMRSSYKQYARPSLGELTTAGEAIDLVYLSHIDLDHIGGIVQLMDDEVDWRVYSYQSSQGNTKFKKPKFPRPPQLKTIWHNAFSDMVEDNQGEIEAQLNNNSRLMSINTLLEGEARISLKQMAETYTDLANGVREGLELSNRVGAAQLNIPVNPEFNGGLIFADDAPAKVALGGMDLYIIGPFKQDLLDLRKDWNKWLEENKKIVKEIRDEAKKEAEDFPMDEGSLLLSSMLGLAAKLGDRKRVTVPNLASLMLLVEEEGVKILMTGDGHATDILKGLAKYNKLDQAGKLHVNVLKVQHHGSENNIDEDFCKKISADHYIFCGNGAHKNPDLDVVQLIIDTRLTNGPAGKFKLWFNSSEKMAGTENNEAQMKQVEDLVEQEASHSHGRMSYRFIRRGSRFEIKL